MLQAAPKLQLVCRAGIGAAKVGKLVIAQALNMGLLVVVNDPYVSEESIIAMGAETLELDELLRLSDFILLNLSLTNETVNILNDETLALVKPGCRIVNCAQGGLIDEEALAAAITSGKVAVLLSMFSGRSRRSRTTRSWRSIRLLLLRTSGLQRSMLRRMALFKKLNFDFDSVIKKERFVKEKWAELHPRKDITGMQITGLIATGNTDKLLTLATNLEMPLAENVIFVAEGKEPPRYRGWFFVLMAIAGIIKIVSLNKKKGDSGSEVIEQG